MAHHHTHHHHRHNKPQTGVRLLITILLNIGITVAQLIGGMISGSMALISDALHNFSDVVALVISYIASKLMERQPTSNKTYGYQRAEILAAFVNALMLVVIAGMIIKEAISSLFTPSHIASMPVILLALLSIVLNGVSVLIILKESKTNMNIRSSMIHLFTDMLTSIAVFISGLVMHFTDIVWIDPVISIGIAIYLIMASLSIVKSSAKVLMQFAPDSPSIFEVETYIEAFESIANVHHIHLWQLSENEILLEAHIEFSENVSLSRTTEIILEIREALFEKYNIEHATFQPEIGREGEKELIKTHSHKI